VTIPRFSLSHDTFQPADSAKYLIFSARLGVASAVETFRGSGPGPCDDR